MLRSHWSPSRDTVPSTTASTFNRRAISGIPIVRMPELCGGDSGRNLEQAGTDELGGQGIGEGLHQPVLCGVTGEVLQRQNRNRATSAGCSRLQRRSPQPPRSRPKRAAATEGQEEHHPDGSRPAPRSRRRGGLVGSRPTAVGTAGQRRTGGVSAASSASPLHGCDETVAVLGQSLHEARILHRIGQGFPQFLDGAADARCRSSRRCRRARASDAARPE